MKKRIIAAISLSLFVSAGFASEWNNFLSINQKDDEYFFDAESVEKSKDIVSVWIKSVRTYTADSDGSWSKAIRLRMNCPRRTIQVVSSSTYNSDGKFIKSSSSVGSEEIAIPDSIGDGLLKVVCLADFPKNTPATKDSYFRLKGNDIFLATKIFVELRKSSIDNAPN